MLRLFTVQKATCRRAAQDGEDDGLARMRSE